MENMNVEQFKNEIAKTDKPVIATFSATWCGPCKMFAPIFEKASGELVEKFNFAKLDVDVVPTLSAEYEVMTVPTILLFKNGEVVKRKAGGFPTVGLLDKWAGEQASL